MLAIVALTSAIIILLASQITPFYDLGESTLASEFPSESQLLRTLIISEVVTSNPGTFLDEDGDAPDWIELHNRSDSAINLHDWSIGRMDKQRAGWVFPQVLLPPGERIVVFASAKNRANPEGELHTDFVLSREGGVIGIRPPHSRQLSDVLEIPEVPRGASYGRGEADTELDCFFYRPSPWGPSGRCHATADLGAPTLSHTSGFFDQEIFVSITSENPQDPIYYTLDGSTPDPERNSSTRRYEGPLRITPTPEQQPQLNDIPSTITSEHFSGSWVHEKHVIRGTPQQATVLRASTTESADTTATYFVGDGYARESFPIISLMIDPHDLIDHETGIHVTGRLLEDYLTSSEYHREAPWGEVPANFRAAGRGWQRPLPTDHRTAVFELCERAPTCGSQTRVRLNVHGKASRLNGLKSFRLYADDDPSLPLFPAGLLRDDGPAHRRVLLRNSGNDFGGLMFKDAYLQTLMSHFEAETQAYLPAVVFLNGEYWGIMNLRERYDQHYLAVVHGADPSTAVIVGRFHEVETGDPTEGQRLRDLQRWIATTDPTEPEYRSKIEAELDLINFFDFLIAHLFAGNLDWPGNNVRVWRQPTAPNSPPAEYGPADGRWRWMVFDLDLSGEGPKINPDYNPFALRMRPGLGLGTHDGYPAMFHQMMQHSEIRTDFLNRFADHLNTAFSPERTVSELGRITSVLSQEIDRHLDRWGPHDSSQEWRDLVDRKREFMELRPAIQRRHLEELFNMDPSVEVNLLVDGRGQVRVNTVLIDPSTPGVPNDREWTGRYWPEHPITLQAQAEGGARFLRWEGVSTPDATRPVIVIAPQEAMKVRAVFSF